MPLLEPYMQFLYIATGNFFNRDLMTKKKWMYDELEEKIGSFNLKL